MPEKVSDAFRATRDYLASQHETLCDGVEGWLVNMRKLDLCWPKHSNSTSLLTNNERKRWSDYRAIADGGLRARSFLYGRSIQRLLLAERLQEVPDQVPFTTNAYGKPQLQDCPLHFNISHSGSWLWLVISQQGPVGADVECLQTLEPVTDTLMAMATSPCEQLAVIKSPVSERDHIFLRLWVLKEAYLKAVGSGLLQDPRQLQVTDDNMLFHIRQPHQYLCSQAALIWNDSCVLSWVHL